MSYKVNEAGELVEVVEQPVDESAVQAQLQQEADESQNVLNTHTANLTEAEQLLADLEAQADAANKAVEEHKAAQEVALARVQKSQDSLASLAAALELRNAAVGAESAEPVVEDSGEPAESEEVAVPVSVVAAEG